MDLDPDGVVPPESEAIEGGDATVRNIEAMLDEDRPEEALAAIEAALATGTGNPIDLYFLRGDTLLGLGRAADAERDFRAVLARDPDCPTSRCWLALSLFQQWRFDEAAVAVRAARELPDAVPDADVVLGALLERQGDYPAADELFEHAASIAPDKYQVPFRMSRQEFDREVKKAVRLLPKQFRQCLDRVPVVVQDLPGEDLAEAQGDGELAPDMLGLFDGVPLPETAEFDAMQLRPNTIYLFQRNLERMSRDSLDLVEQIRITLWHELAHYLGFEEEDMEDLGLE